MTPIIVFGIIVLSIASLLIFGIIFFSILKYIKRQYYPNWKFRITSAWAMPSIYTINTLKRILNNKGPAAQLRCVTGLIFAFRILLSEIIFLRIVN
jgi:hypothetical protein